MKGFGYKHVEDHHIDTKAGNKSISHVYEHPQHHDETIGTTSERLSNGTQSELHHHSSINVGKASSFKDVAAALVKKHKNDKD